MKLLRRCFFIHGDGRIERGVVGSWTTNQEDSSALLQVILQSGSLVALSRPAVERSLFFSKKKAVAQAIRVIDAWIDGCLSKAETATQYRRLLVQGKVP